MLEKMLAHLLRTEVKQRVDSRIEEFEKPKGPEELFEELSFCVLAANYSAERSWRIQEAVGDGFLNLPEQALSRELKRLGYRFPNVRARYIVENRVFLPLLEQVAYGMEEKEARTWLVNNAKGIGMKEASHFLRNVGRKNLAILDFHILDVLEKEGVVKKPKTLTPKRYLEIEERVDKLARSVGLSLAELDLYLWFSATGKVLK